MKKKLLAGLLSLMVVFSSLPLVSQAAEANQDYMRLQLEMSYPTFNLDGYYTDESYADYEAALDYANFITGDPQLDESHITYALDWIAEAKYSLVPINPDTDRDLNVQKLMFNILRMSSLNEEDYSEGDWEYIDLATERAIETLFSSNSNSRVLTMDSIMLKMLSHNLNKVTDMDVSDIYSDVKDDAWYSSGVLFVRANGLMSGNNGLFNPTADITRAQLVTTLYRLAGEPVVRDTSALTEFSDIAEDKYYTDAVCWAYRNGIVTGNDGKFNPTGKLTRQQMAAFFYRFSEYMRLDTAAKGDVSSMLNADKVSDYAKVPMEWAVGSGYISGSQVTDVNGNVAYDLNPRGNTTRAQVATILMRFCLEN